MLDKVFEWLFAAILVIVLLPCIVSILVHELGPVLLTVAVVAGIIGAYRYYDRAKSHATKTRNNTSGERQPIFPRGDH
jgi:cytochrome bd-type quinol oxidase subunit 1